MKQEGHAQYRCDLLDKNMFEENCKFEWDQMTSHYALTSNCTNAYDVCNDPSKICIPEERSSTYTCQNKSGVQTNQKMFCDQPSYQYGINVNWKSPYCGVCHHLGGVYILRRRFNEDFNRMWNEYKGGFGKFDSDYWIGLEMLHQITNPPVQLQIFIVGPGVSDHGFTMYFENFSIASESENYRISLSSSGDSEMVTNHNGKVFSTFDKGEKQAKARMFGAGWWYGEIESVNWFTGYWKQYLNITNPAVTITAVDCIITRYV